MYAADFGLWIQMCNNAWNLRVLTFIHFMSKEKFAMMI